MSKVVIKECGNYNLDLMTKCINEGMETLGGWDKYVYRGAKVLLKVNLIGPKTSDSGAITHCEFTRVITKILKQKGCTVWIGDSSGGAIAGMAPTAQSFGISGIDKVAKEEGAIIKNFDKEGAHKCDNDLVYGEMYISKVMFDADVVINLPKLKTHSAAMYTGAIKNLFGCIPGLKKAYYHKIAPNPLDFGDVIVDINNACNVNLHIMDGIEAMQGEGPTAGTVYNAKKIIISEDPLALDMVASSMIGMDFDAIPILKKAKDRSLGESDLNKISLLGDYNSIPNLSNFVFPKKYNSNKKQNYKALVKVIDFFKARPVVNMKKCKHCNMCVESCPVEVIDKESKAINYDKCIECLCCHELCLHKAIEIKKVNPIANVIANVSGGKYK